MKFKSKRNSKKYIFERYCRNVQKVIQFMSNNSAFQNFLNNTERL